MKKPDSQVAAEAAETAETTPQGVLQAFWRRHEKDLKAAISKFPQRKDLRRYGAPYGTHRGKISHEIYLKASLRHEAAFIEHVLTRLVQIINEAQERHALDKNGIIFNINTSMLYDVDETLGSEHAMLLTAIIRPSAKILFEFIRNFFPNIRLGITSARSQDVLDQQMEEESVRFSLTEIAPFINGDVHGVYNVGGGFVPEERNVKAFDLTIYPDHSPEDFNSVLQNEIGYSREEVEKINFDELPVFVEAAIHEEALREPQLEFAMEWRSMKGSLGYKEQQKLGHEIVAEILMHTLELADLIDSQSDDEAALKQIALRVEEASLEEMDESKKVLLRPAIQTGIAASYQFLKNLEPIDRRRRELLMEKAKECIDMQMKANLSSFVASYGEESGVPENAYYMLRKKARAKGRSVRLMNSEFTNSLSAAVKRVQDRNYEHRHEFDKYLAELLGVAEEHTAVALQRLAFCKKQVENGAAAVAVAIDNEKVAEQMDQLLQGNIADPETGEKIDGFALLKIPPEYRGRFYLIHVGKNAEYDRSVFQQLVQEVMAEAA